MGFFGSGQVAPFMGGLGLLNEDEWQRRLAAISGGPMSQTQQAPQTRYPLETAPPTRGDRIGSALGNIASGLGAAQSFLDGEPDKAVASLRGAAESRSKAATAAQAAQQRNLIIGAMRQQGYTDDQIALSLTNPEALGTNYNQRMGTRVVAPGSSIVQGGPGGQQQAYRQPNQWEQYADSLGLQPGTKAYEDAMRDYRLGANGPTAYANDVGLEGVRQGNRMGLERQRQQNRERMEGVRQGNRITTRQTPTYRDTNGAPPRAGGSRSAERTATGPNGQKLYLRNGRWVDEQGRPVQ